MRSQMHKLVGSALLAFLALHLLPAEAMAAKEKFERTKPHVNVGTIGDTAGDTNQLTTTGSGGGTTVETGQGCEPDPAKVSETRPAC